MKTQLKVFGGVFNSASVLFPQNNFRNFSPTSLQLFHQKHYVYFLFSVLVENLSVKVRDYVRKVNTVKVFIMKFSKTLTVSSRNWNENIWLTCFSFGVMRAKNYFSFLLQEIKTLNRAHLCPWEGARQAQNY